MSQHLHPWLWMPSCPVVRVPCVAWRVQGGRVHDNAWDSTAHTLGAPGSPASGDGTYHSFTRSTPAAPPSLSPNSPHGLASANVSHTGGGGAHWQQSGSHVAAAGGGGGGHLRHADPHTHAHASMQGRHRQAAHAAGGEGRAVSGSDSMASLQGGRGYSGQLGASTSHAAAGARGGTGGDDGRPFSSNPLQQPHSGHTHHTQHSHQHRQQHPQQSGKRPRVRSSAAPGTQDSAEGGPQGQAAVRDAYAALIQ